MAVIKTVQYGTTTMAAATTALDVTITSVDSSAAFLLFGSEYMVQTVNNANQHLVRGLMADPTTIRFSRLASGQTITVDWFVPEFSSGVSVQRGLIPMGASTTNLLITSVDTSQSFVTWSRGADDTVFSSDEFSQLRLVQPTSIRSVIQAVNTVSGAWQVITFSGGSTVQRGVYRQAATESISTITLTAVDTTASILLYQYLTVGNLGSNANQHSMRGTLRNGTTLVLFRESTSATVPVETSWEVVEFTDGTSVQMGTAALVTSSSNNISITEVDTSRSVALIAGLYGRGGSATNNDAEYGSKTWGRVSFVGMTSLRAKRFSALTNWTPAWFVVQFNTAAVAAAVELDESFVFTSN